MMRVNVGEMREREKERRWVEGKMEMTTAYYDRRTGVRARVKG